MLCHSPLLSFPYPKYEGSGIKKDAYAIDYQATLNCLESGRAVNARHFVLLSAFCVKNPWLQFQQAKLKFEGALTAQNDMSYSKYETLFKCCFIQS